MPQTIISTKIDPNKLPKPIEVDGGIPAYVLNKDEIFGLKPNVIGNVK